jgi:hypothetical protein
MEIKRYRYSLLFLVFALYTGLHLPGQEITALILSIYFPGVLLTSLWKDTLNTTEVIVLPLLWGMSFWIVFTYFISELNIFSWVLILGISGLSAFFADRRNIQIHTHRDSLVHTLFLVIICLFMVSYVYPWSQYVSFIPPGDDMKFHATHIQTIVSEHSLPESYGSLYPELDSFSYPVGYHILISLAALFSAPTVASMMLSTIMLIPLSCFSFYFLGTSLFDEKVGLYAAFSLSFLSLFFHQLLHTATYPNLIAITLQVYAFSILYDLYTQKKSMKKSILCSLLFAASALTHSYILIITGFFLCFLSFILFVQRKSSLKMVIYVGCGFLMLIIPFFLRLEFQQLSPVEMVRLSEWYVRDSLDSIPDFMKALSVLSPLLLFLGITGSFMITQRNVQVFLGAWGGAILLIPLLSVVPVYYPGWYTISPDRFFFHICAPLCIGCGVFIARVQSHLSKKRFLFFVGILTVVGVGMHHANALNSFSQDPTFEVQMNPDDAWVMDWIAQNTPEESIILNTGPTIDCSSWIPVVSSRRVVFPCFSVHRGDGCIRNLKPYEKEIDLKIMESAPDSREALEILKAYSIDYVYIPAWKKVPFLDLSPQALTESPLYQPVVKKGDAHLFRVLYDRDPRNTFVELAHRKKMIFKSDEITTLPFSLTFSPDVQGSLFLKVTYTDDFIGWVNVGQADTFIDSIFTYGTGEQKMMMLPLSLRDPVDVYLHAEHDFTVEEMTVLLAVEDARSLSPQVFLVGSWIHSNKIVAESGDLTLRIYLFHVREGALTLTYYDTGKGDVDINVPGWFGDWEAVATVERGNTGTLQKITIPLDGAYTVYVLGVYVNGERMVFTSIEYTDTCMPS